MKLAEVHGKALLKHLRLALKIVRQIETNPAFSTLNKPNKPKANSANGGEQLELEGAKLFQRG